ncbi:hypothetical protein CCACVL1_20684 [Corchorus capsularis]|uniref:Uncharacterized protein n=2 Tax=Corchorus TaxID=93758 RepID=A0A1R3HA60_COCAP|nr:hypothetical protein CCACVL1_20684 [Corchorus capsularis]OMO91726.1 hypothetical protein COLO4_18147 [Corchorus olitorius]
MTIICSDLPYINSSDDNKPSREKADSASQIGPEMDR